MVSTNNASPYAPFAVITNCFPFPFPSQLTVHPHQQIQLTRSSPEIDHVLISHAVLVVGNRSFLRLLDETREGFLQGLAMLIRGVFGECWRASSLEEGGFANLTLDVLCAFILLRS